MWASGRTSGWRSHGTIGPARPGLSLWAAPAGVRRPSPSPSDVHRVVLTHVDWLVGKGGRRRQTWASRRALAAFARLARSGNISKAYDDALIEPLPLEKGNSQA